MTRRQTPEQAERRRAADRLNTASARVADGEDPGDIPNLIPALRRVVLPVPRAPQGWQDRAAYRTSPPEWCGAQTDAGAAGALQVCAGRPATSGCCYAAAAGRARPGVRGGVDLSAADRQAAAS